MVSTCYIIENNGHAIVVDPGFDSDKVKDYLRAQNLVLDVIYATHGHFDHIGGTCLYSKGILISGDTLFRETVGRTDLYMSSFEQIKDSILRKLYILPEDTVCYPGHGLTTTIGHEMRHNAFVRK